MSGIGIKGLETKTNSEDGLDILKDFLDGYGKLNYKDLVREIEEDVGGVRVVLGIVEDAIENLFKKYRGKFSEIRDKKDLAVAGFCMDIGYLYRNTIGNFWLNKKYKEFVGYEGWRENSKMLENFDEKVMMNSWSDILETGDIDVNESELDNYKYKFADILEDLGISDLDEIKKTLKPILTLDYYKISLTEEKQFDYSFFIHLDYKIIIETYNKFKEKVDNLKNLKVIPEDERNKILSDIFSELLWAEEEDYVGGEVKTEVLEDIDKKLDNAKKKHEELEKKKEEVRKIESKSKSYVNQNRIILEHLSKQNEKLYNIDLYISNKLEEVKGLLSEVPGWGGEIWEGYKSDFGLRLMILGFDETGLEIYENSVSKDKIDEKIGKLFKEIKELEASKVDILRDIQENESKKLENSLLIYEGEYQKFKKMGYKDDSSELLELGWSYYNEIGSINYGLLAKVYGLGIGDHSFYDDFGSNFVNPFSEQNNKKLSTVYQQLSKVRVWYEENGTEFEKKYLNGDMTGALGLVNSVELGINSVEKDVVDIWLSYKKGSLKKTDVAKEIGGESRANEYENVGYIILPYKSRFVQQMEERYKGEYVAEIQNYPRYIAIKEDPKTGNIEYKKMKGSGAWTYEVESERLGNTMISKSAIDKVGKKDYEIGLVLENSVNLTSLQTGSEFLYQGFGNMKNLFESSLEQNKTANFIATMRENVVKLAEESKKFFKLEKYVLGAKTELEKLKKYYSDNKGIATSEMEEFIESKIVLVDGLIKALTEPKVQNFMKSMQDIIDNPGKFGEEDFVSWIIKDAIPFIVSIVIAVGMSVLIKNPFAAGAAAGSVGASVGSFLFSTFIITAGGMLGNEVGSLISSGVGKIMYGKEFSNYSQLQAKIVGKNFYNEQTGDYSEAGWSEIGRMYGIQAVDMFKQNLLTMGLGKVLGPYINSSLQRGLTSSNGIVRNLSKLIRVIGDLEATAINPAKMSFIKKMVNEIGDEILEEGKQTGIEKASEKIFGGGGNTVSTLLGILFSSKGNNSYMSIGEFDGKDLNVVSKGEPEVNGNKITNKFDYNKENQASVLASLKKQHGENNITINENGEIEWKVSYQNKGGTEYEIVNRFIPTTNAIVMDNFLNNFLVKKYNSKTKKIEVKKDNLEIYGIVKRGNGVYTVKNSDPSGRLPIEKLLLKNGFEQIYNKETGELKFTKDGEIFVLMSENKWISSGFVFESSSSVESSSGGINYRSTNNGYLQFDRKSVNAESQSIISTDGTKKTIQEIFDQKISSSDGESPKKDGKYEYVYNNQEVNLENTKKGFLGVLKFLGTSFGNDKRGNPNGILKTSYAFDSDLKYMGDADFALDPQTFLNNNFKLLLLAEQNKDVKLQEMKNGIYGLKFYNKTTNPRSEVLSNDGNFDNLIQKGQIKAGFLYFTDGVGVDVEIFSESGNDSFDMIHNSKPVLLDVDGIKVPVSGPKDYLKYCETLLETDYPRELDMNDAMKLKIFKRLRNYIETLEIVKKQENKEVRRAKWKILSFLGKIFGKKNISESYKETILTWLEQQGYLQPNNEWGTTFKKSLQEHSSLVDNGGSELPSPNEFMNTTVKLKSDIKKTLSEGILIKQSIDKLKNRILELEKYNYFGEQNFAYFNEFYLLKNIYLPNIEKIYADKQAENKVVDWDTDKKEQILSETQQKTGLSRDFLDKTVNIFDGENQFYLQKDYIELINSLKNEENPFKRKKSLLDFKNKLEKETDGIKDAVKKYNQLNHQLYYEQSSMSVGKGGSFCSCIGLYYIHPEVADINLKYIDSIMANLDFEIDKLNYLDEITKESIMADLDNTDEVLVLQDSDVVSVVESENSDGVILEDQNTLPKTKSKNFVEQVTNSLGQKLSLPSDFWDNNENIEKSNRSYYKDLYKNKVKELFGEEAYNLCFVQDRKTLSEFDKDYVKFVMSMAKDDIYLAEVESVSTLLTDMDNYLEQLESEGKNFDTQNALNIFGPRLKDLAPELQFTFIDVIIKYGDRVSTTMGFIQNVGEKKYYSDSLKFLSHIRQFNINGLNKDNVVLEQKGDVLVFYVTDPVIYSLAYNGTADNTLSGGFATVIEFMSGKTQKVNVINGNPYTETNSDRAYYLKRAEIHELGHSKNKSTFAEYLFGLEKTSQFWNTVSENDGYTIDQAPITRAKDEIVEYVLDGSDYYTIKNILTKEKGLYDYYRNLYGPQIEKTNKDIKSMEIKLQSDHSTTDQIEYQKLQKKYNELWFKYTTLKAELDAQVVDLLDISKNLIEKSKKYPSAGLTKQKIINIFTFPSHKWKKIAELYDYKFNEIIKQDEVDKKIIGNLVSEGILVLENSNGDAFYQDSNGVVTLNLSSPDFESVQWNCSNFSDVNIKSGYTQVVSFLEKNKFYGNLNIKNVKLLESKLKRPLSKGEIQSFRNMDVEILRQIVVLSKQLEFENIADLEMIVQTENYIQKLEKIKNYLGTTPNINEEFKEMWKFESPQDFKNSKIEKLLGNKKYNPKDWDGVSIEALDRASTFNEFIVNSENIQKQYGVFNSPKDVLEFMNYTDEQIVLFKELVRYTRIKFSDFSRNSVLKQVNQQNVEHLINIDSELLRVGIKIDPFGLDDYLNTSIEDLNKITKDMSRKIYRVGIKISINDVDKLINIEKQMFDKVCENARELKKLGFETEYFVSIFSERVFNLEQSDFDYLEKIVPYVKMIEKRLSVTSLYYLLEYKKDGDWSNIDKKVTKLNEFYLKYSGETKIGDLFSLNDLQKLDELSVDQLLHIFELSDYLTKKIDWFDLDYKTLLQITKDDIDMLSDKLKLYYKLGCKRYDIKDNLIGIKDISVDDLSILIDKKALLDGLDIEINPDDIENYILFFKKGGEDILNANGLSDTEKVLLMEKAIETLNIIDFSLNGIDSKEKLLLRFDKALTESMQKWQSQERKTITGTELSPEMKKYIDKMFRFGEFAKSRDYEVEVVDPKTGQTRKVKRKDKGFFMEQQTGNCREIAAINGIRVSDPDFQNRIYSSLIYTKSDNPLDAKWGMKFPLGDPDGEYVEVSLREMFSERDKGTEFGEKFDKMTKDEKKEILGDVAILILRGSGSSDQGEFGIPDSIAKKYKTELKKGEFNTEYYPVSKELLTDINNALKSRKGELYDFIADYYSGDDVYNAVNAPMGYMVLEALLSKHTRGKGKVNKKAMVGGLPSDAMKWMLGEKNYNFNSLPLNSKNPIYKNHIDHVLKNFSSGKFVVTLDVLHSSLLSSTTGYFSYNGNWMAKRHAYSVVGVDYQNGMVEVVNPWDNNTIIPVKMDDFMNIFDNIMIAERK